MLSRGRGLNPGLSLGLSLRNGLGLILMDRLRDVFTAKPRRPQVS